MSECFFTLKILIDLKRKVFPDTISKYLISPSLWWDNKFCDFTLSCFSNGGGQILFSEFVDWALEKNLDLEDDIDED